MIPMHLPMCCAYNSCTWLSAWQLMERTGWSRAAGLLNCRCHVYLDCAHRPDHNSLLVSGIPKVLIPRSHLRRLSFHEPEVWPGGGLWKLPGDSDKQTSLGTAVVGCFQCRLAFGGKWWRVEKNCGLCLVLGISVHFCSEEICINYLTVQIELHLGASFRPLEIQFLIWLWFIGRFWSIN